MAERCSLGETHSPSTRGSGDSSIRLAEQDRPWRRDGWNRRVARLFYQKGANCRSKRRLVLIGGIDTRSLRWGVLSFST
jgi:hypothetical protein